MCVRVNKCTLYNFFRMYAQVCLYQKRENSLRGVICLTWLTCLTYLTHVCDHERPADATEIAHTIAVKSLLCTQQKTTDKQKSENKRERKIRRRKLYTINKEQFFKKREREAKCIRLAQYLTSSRRRRVCI